ncbi:MAG: hypothetical protein H7835_20650, partial [Magnetococcus sp. XQGC-1]
MNVSDSAEGVLLKIYRCIREATECSEFIDEHRSSTKDFTRQRKLTFQRLVMLLLSQITRSLQNELDHFFQALG